MTSILCIMYGVSLCTVNTKTHEYKCTGNNRDSTITSEFLWLHQQEFDCNKYLGGKKGAIK